MLLSINGESVPAADAGHAVLGRDFLLQDGIFETLRIYAGTAFKLREHIARFKSAALKLGVPFPSNIESVLSREIATAAATGLGDAFLRVTLTRQAPDTSVLVTMIDQLPHLNADLYQKGIHVVTSATRRNEFALTAGIKTTALLLSLLEFRATSILGADDALFLDTLGHLSEGSASNIFLVSNGVLHTPPTSCGALPGITRATVIGLAAGMGLSVFDSNPIELEQVHAATEMFLTSSIREIVPVVAVDGQIIGPGKPGPITLNITKAYKKVTA